jgi:large subunit ribosomal protein L25
MADKSFKISSRTVVGKKTRFLRHQGLTPAHLFGHNIDSLPVQCSTSELQHTIAKKGTTRLLDVTLSGEKEPRSVFIREIQRDALSGELIHVDFYQVNKNERIRVAVPVVLVGEAPASKLKNNIIEQLVNELEIESLPGELPPQIEVDITPLTDVNNSISIRDLKLKKGVIVLAAPELLLVKVSAIAEEKEEIPVAVAATPAEVAAPTSGKGPVVEGEATKTGKAEKSEKAEKPEKKG